MPHTVSSLFRTYAEAAEAVERLRAAGFPDRAMSLLSNDPTMDRSELAPYQPHEEPEDGDAVATGAGVGVLAGGAAGAVAGLGVLAIPGAAPLVAAGWLASTLAGASAGGVAGGLIGALTSAGVTEDEARAYGEGLKRGGTFVVVRVSRSDAGDRAVDILSEVSAGTG
ncbi:hypothetical protein [Phreatobacter sp.]|uniref:hypothetical protein n=1 Tax=Phreatobacter sp. TaxID=1966341 RepID=UPI003F706E45